MSKATYILGCIFLSLSSITCAMVFDNRFMPLLQKPPIIVDCRPSYVMGNAFFVTGSRAVGIIEEEQGIPELFGKFDLKQLSRALDRLGLPNPIPSQLRIFDFPYRVDGVIQGQGIEVAYRQAFLNYYSVGFDWLFMRLHSRQQFRIDVARIPGTNDFEIDEFRRQIFQELGLTQADSTRFGSGDLDAYFRVGNTWYYLWKFRRLDAGFRAGALFPTGLSRNINSPASIPFGGDGFWGFYVAADADFEIKEDMSAGLFMRLSKRFTRTRLERVPVEGEPEIFGALVAPVSINPGATFIFSPYLTLENLRAGLGIRINYFLTKHQADDWTPVACEEHTIPIKLEKAEALTGWKSDYFSINIFYDFGKVKVHRGLDPIVMFSWDIPSLLFASEKIALTHKVSLGVELHF